MARRRGGGCLAFCGEGGGCLMFFAGSAAAINQVIVACTASIGIRLVAATAAHRVYAPFYSRTGELVSHPPFASCSFASSSCCCCFFSTSFTRSIAGTFFWFVMAETERSCENRGVAGGGVPVVAVRGG